jgi:hypothetical protein
MINEYVAHHGMRIGRGNWSSRKKPTLVPWDQTKILPCDITWDRIGGRWGRKQLHILLLMQHYPALMDLFFERKIHIKHLLVNFFLATSILTYIFHETHFNFVSKILGKMTKQKKKENTT